MITCAAAEVGPLNVGIGPINCSNCSLLYLHVFCNDEIVNTMLVYHCSGSQALVLVNRREVKCHSFP